MVERFIMVYAGNSGNKLKVISASRRLDLVGCYPDDLVHLLHQKCPPEKVHTLVLWTKNATNLLHHSELAQQVGRYSQIHLHYTVTGMGGSMFEPAVPTTADAMAMLPPLIDLVKTPELIRFRFDPIVHFLLPDGNVYCNLSLFEKIAAQVASLGIKNISISWMSAYKKVIKRLALANTQVIEISREQRQQEYEFLTRIADANHLTIHWCSVTGLPRSSCIDGVLYNHVHPDGLKCSTKRARGQRQECGCTESWDIGWYHPCLHGCLYCYANPIER